MDTTTSACIITPADFGTGSMKDPIRNDWTLGKIRPVVEALRGQRVAVVTDKRTGHTLVGVTLVRCYDGGPGSGPRLLVESTYGDGTTSRTAYYLWSVGAILPLASPIGTKDAKWVALEAARKERGHALTAARELFTADGHEDHGKWEISLTEVGASVSYTRQSGEGIRHWHVSMMSDAYMPAPVEA